MTFHFDFARQNGVTEDEPMEARPYLACYSRWPCGMSAMTVAKSIFTKKN